MFYYHFYGIYINNIGLNMKKLVLNEEISKMRKMMGLKEGEDFDLSSVDNPNAYTDDIFNYGSERGGEDMDDVDFEKSAIESASGEKVVQREFDDYDRPLYWSLTNDYVNYFIGDGKNGKMIFKYNAKTGENTVIGDLKDYDAPERAKDSEDNELFEGGRSDEYDDSHGSPYDRGHSDAYYRREKDPHKYPEGSYNGERVTDLSPEEIEAYYAGYDGCTDFKDFGEMDEIAESDISEGTMQSGVYYDTTIAHELKNKVGNLHKIAPYVLELGDRVVDDINGRVYVYDEGKLIEKFSDVDAFLVGIKYGATPV